MGSALLCRACFLSYRHFLPCLNVLYLQSLELRRIKTDLFSVKKSIYGFDDVDSRVFIDFGLNIISTRSNGLKFCPPLIKKDVAKGFFSTRTVGIWNDLPSACSSFLAARNRPICEFNLDEVLSFNVLILFSFLCCNSNVWLVSCLMMNKEMIT